EFYFEFADFQHAYQAGGGGGGEGNLVPNGALDHDGAPVMIPSYADFPNAVNPSVRQIPAPSPHETDLYFFPPDCPGGVPRPCPEAISAEDPGTYVVNYRNEPVGARVFDRATATQAAGDAGDLAFAYASIPRSNVALNSQPTTYPALTADVGPYDPYTPMMRAYMGDEVRIRIQVGAHEEEHTFTVHGMKWRQEPLNGNSGWRNSMSAGISEYMVLQTPVAFDVGSGTPAKVDYLYTMGAATEDLWNGVWGLFRSYGKVRRDLAPLPNSPTSFLRNNQSVTIANRDNYDGACPRSVDGQPIPVREYKVAAVRAADVLGPEGLVYNTRATALDDALGAPGLGGTGPLHDPDALLYVFLNDVVFNSAGHPVGLRPGTPIEPIVLRASAGDCIKTELSNFLPETLDELPGFNNLPPVIKKGEVNGGIVTFNSNDLDPSSIVGLTPQLVSSNMRTDGAIWVGANSHAAIRPGLKARYTWYAGDTSIGSVQTSKTGVSVTLVSRPVEFGAANLIATDTIKGASKGLVGALVIEPPGSTWTTDPGSHVSATVSFPDGAGGTVEFREFVTVLQNDVNLRFSGQGPADAAALPPGLQKAVPNLSAADDAQDSGSKAVNYGAEPLWYRLGMSPATDFSAGLRDTLDNHRVFSNSLVGGEDPQTAVFTVSPTKNQMVRMRLLQPGGHARGIEFTTHGHPWQRQPYVQRSDRMSWTFHDDPTRLDLQDAVDEDRHTGIMGGHNMVGWWISSQESVSASSHYDMQFRAGGGRDRVTGDFLFRDFGSFGSLGGIWGVIRHDTSPPITADDVFTAAHGGALVATGSGLLANDVDLDGDPFTVDVLASDTTTSRGGTVSWNTDAGFTFTPAPGFAGLDSFQYTVTGGAKGTVYIVGPNDSPMARPDAASTHDGSSGFPGRAVTIDVLENDSDPDGDVPSVTGTSTAEAVVNGDGTITYTPPAGITGETSFTYTLTDGFGGSAEGTVTVSIAPNQVPVAGADVAGADPGGAQVALDVLANDSDPDGDPLSVLTNGAGTLGGTVTTDGHMLFYTPPLDDPVTGQVTGTDTFTYTASDGHGGTATATVSVTIQANRPPQALDDVAFTTIGVRVDVPVLANDADPDGDLMVVAVEAPSVGTATTDGTTVTFTPPAGFWGPATVLYTVSDGRGGLATAMVTITVTDTVTMGQAQYSTRSTKWTVKGSVAPAAVGIKVQLAIGGSPFATALTDASGAWQYIGSGPAASAGAIVTATSGRLGTATAQVSIK
ncbi:MAG TPA: Ig-like domain-containing protein, partial [Acidimicrobiales bacterium]